MARLSPALVQATPLVIEKASGCWLDDKTGRRYLDFTAGIAVASTGHCHPAVVQAAQEQTGRLIHGQYGTVLHEPLLTLVDRLGDVLPEHLDSLFFANSGAEAVEASVRLARNATGRQNVVVFHGSFHGRTIGAAALTTSGARFRAARSGPLAGGVVIAPFPTPFRYGWDISSATRFCLQELDYLFATVTSPEDVAAIIVEPVLGEAGYQPGTGEFFRGLRERADRHGIVLIADEVQTGVGRTGTFWSSAQFDLLPDVLVFAKGIASGFPLSGIAASEALMAKALPGSQGGTYCGNAVACAAAVATIDVIEEEKLVENAARCGALLRAGLEESAKRHDGIADLRGLGLMQAVEFIDEEGRPDAAGARAVMEAALEEGVVILTCGPFANVIRMIPPLVVSEAEIEFGLEVWNAALDTAMARSWPSEPFDARWRIGRTDHGDERS